MTKQKFDYLTVSKINDYIYIGSAEHPMENTEEFSKLGISVCINCASEITYPKKFLMEEKIPLDGGDITFMEYMDSAIHKIAYHLGQERKIYIHCDKGIDRSPSILIYYLMSKHNMSYDKALGVVRKSRPIVRIDPVIESHLRTIEDN